MTEAEELEAVKIGKREIKAMHAAFEAVAAWADDGAADTPDDVVEQIIPLYGTSIRRSITTRKPRFY
jgi:hypothetical protein